MIRSSSRTDSQVSIHDESSRISTGSRSLVYAADSVALSTTISGNRFCNPRLRLESRPLQTLRAGTLRIRMLRVGVCGTDLHLLEQGTDGLIRCTSPLTIPADGRIIGHEGVGVVEEVGPGVDSFEVGDVVCCESIVTCGVCKPCRRGSFNQCEASLLLGLEMDGLFATWADVPSRIVHQVSDLADSATSLNGLACVEPAAVAFLACQNAKIHPGDSVLVLGGGPIGYFTALLAGQMFGASRVCLSEPGEFRRNFASEVAETTVQPEEVAGLGQTFDVLIEAAGALSSIDPLLETMRPNGRIVLLARTGVSLVITRVDELITKSLTVVGSRGHLGGAFDAVLELMRSGRLDLRQVVTRSVVGLADLMEALKDPAGIVARDCKVVVDLSAE